MGSSLASRLPVFPSSVRRSSAVAALALCCSGPAGGPPQPIPATVATKQAPRVAAPVGPHPRAPHGGWNPESLATLSLRELHLVRNEPFAAAGQPFVKDWLDAHFRHHTRYTPTQAVDPSRMTPLERTQARLAAEAAAGLSARELQRRRQDLQELLRAGRGQDHHAIELQLLARSLGENVHRWAEVDGLSTAGRTWLRASSGSAADDTTRLDRPLEEGDVEGLSARDLRLLRATVEARRGRPFAGPLGRHFRRTHWYRPDDTFTRERLTPSDWDNLGRLDAWAAERGSAPSTRGPQDQWGPEAGWYYGS